MKNPISRMKKMMHKPASGSLPDILVCQVDGCNYTEKVQKHCMAPMHIEHDQLVCWMGPDCGTAPLPTHHDQPMKLTFSKS